MEATQPVPSQPEQRKVIVVAIPGQHIHQRTVMSLFGATSFLTQHGFDVVLSSGYDPNIYFARGKCLGGMVNPMQGIDQPLFGGKLAYDYIMWIDSDIVFNGEQILRLISWNYPIVSGAYILQPDNYAIVEKMDDTEFHALGHYKYVSNERRKQFLMQNPGKLMPVAYTGMGFMLVGKGVFESIGYPWFVPSVKEMPGGSKEVGSEDVSFCQAIQKQGYVVWVDLEVLVGHVKTVIF